MPTALVQGRVSVQHAERLRSKLGSDWRVVTWTNGVDALEDFTPRASEADVIIGGGIPLDAWPNVPNLKLFQIPWTGYDFTSPETMPAGVPVANCFEHESSIAEYVMAAMLEWKIGLRRMDRNFRAHGWNGHGPGEAIIHDEVRGTSVGIVGYGHIGAEVAKRAHAFDMRVVGVRRREQSTPPPLAWLGTSEKLEQLLGESDFVVIACDLNDETRGMIDAVRLGQMKPSGVIINISRGAVIDEAALYHALKERRIGGAVIDVWYNYKRPGEREPWPANFPFQELDNTILTAHESGWTEQQIDRRWTFVAANINRAVRGEAPENVVFVGTQAV